MFHASDGGSLGISGSLLFMSCSSWHTITIYLEKGVVAEWLERLSVNQDPRGYVTPAAVRNCSGDFVPSCFVWMKR